MTRAHSYLAPILTGRMRVKYMAANLIWLASAAYFWAWWLQPEHGGEGARFVLLTLCLGWISFLQLFFLFVFWHGQRSVARAPLPGQWRVAMVVTKTPGEPLALLQRTLSAMLAQDYPHDTWLADEDPAPDTVAWCAANGVRISSRKGVAEYHRAEWPRRTRCKEGNLAYFYDHFAYEAYDIVAQLDADHVPQTGYLTEMLRPFADPKVGYVSAPSICGANAGDSWAARARLDTEAAFHGLLQCGYTRLFTPMCIGSHYAVRTSALRAIGGLGPELAEDHSTTMLMAAGGWRGVHAIDAIAVGDGPASVADLAVQEFQWARSLVSLLLMHTPRYLRALPPRLRFIFVFCQMIYPIYALTMAFFYLAPIYALATDQRFADVTYPAFVGHSLPVLAVLCAIIWQIRRDGLLRPYDSRIISKEKALFVFLQWPWALWGCVMAVRDRLSGRFVDFRVTPKGDAASRRLPSKVVAVYAVLAIGAVLPVIFCANADVAKGFYILSSINALIYAAIVATIVFRHLGDTIADLGRRWHAALFQLGSVAGLSLLILTAVIARGTESLYALSIGLSPFRIATAHFAVSGAGMGGTGHVIYQFDPGWDRPKF